MSDLRRQKLTLQKAKIRLARRVEKLRDVVIALKEKQLLTQEALQSLEPFQDVPTLLYKRCQKNQSGVTSREQYSPEMRSFALTLAFYSPKAYRFVRKQFGLALPHLSTIRLDELHNQLCIISVDTVYYLYAIVNCL